MLLQSVDAVGAIISSPCINNIMFNICCLALASGGANLLCVVGATTHSPAQKPVNRISYRDPCFVDTRGRGRVAEDSGRSGRNRQ